MTSPIRAARRFAHHWQHLHTTQKYSAVAFVVTLGTLTQIFYSWSQPLHYTQVLGATTSSDSTNLNIIPDGLSPGDLSDNTDTPATSPADPNCTNSGGTWRQFSNGCADFCGTKTPDGRPNPDIACTQALTDSCDCGAGACWDSTTCVGNSTTLPNPNCTYDNTNQIVCPSLSQPICQPDTQATGSGTDECGCQLPPTCQPISSATPNQITCSPPNVCDPQGYWCGQDSILTPIPCSTTTVTNCSDGTHDDQCNADHTKRCVEGTLFTDNSCNLTTSTDNPPPTTTNTTCYPADINTDGTVNITDLATLISHFFSSDPSTDLNHDGIVDLTDYSLLVSAWGQTSSCN